MGSPGSRQHRASKARLGSKVLRDRRARLVVEENRVVAVVASLTAEVSHTEAVGNTVAEQ